MEAVLLSAGRGSRLLPLTLEMPKCLVMVDGRTILDHQIAALRGAGIARITVVGGYRHDQVAAHLARSGDGGVRLVRNPFWDVASSIGSVWAARDRLGRPFCLLNGDTIFSPAIVAAALAAARPGVNLVVEPLGAPEPDDMLVEAADGAIGAVGKRLDPARATHRSLGIVLARDADGGGYADALDAVIGAPGGADAFHHAVVDRLARTAGVGAIVVRDARWQEIDRPEDIARWSAPAR